MLKDKNQPYINIVAVERDYERGDLFDERDERSAAVMRILNERLTRDERRIMILFAECGSNITETAAMLGVSRPTFRKYINGLRRKVLNFYKNEQI